MFEERLNKSKVGGAGQPKAGDDLAAKNLSQNAKGEFLSMQAE